MAAAIGEHDVVILGGGPTGTAAALTLLSYSSRRVAVVERSDYTGARVGETVSPGLRPMLDYLGVWERFEAAGHLPAYGSASAWGGPEVMARDFLFTGRGNGWHLDRARFDRMLADAVVERGGALLARTWLTSLAPSTEGGWSLEVESPDGRRLALRAGVVIDASGRPAALARRLGARRHVLDRLVGVVGFHDAPASQEQSRITLVETCPHGWWYSALLPDHRLVVAFMSDGDLVRRQNAHRPEGWAALLGETVHTRLRLRGARLAHALTLRSAQSQYLEPAAGPGWVAAGDAACAFDPLASMGIGHAVSSGIHAARVADDQLRTRSAGSLLEGYLAGVRDNFRQYLQLRQRHYRVEQRWPDAPFWARRHGDATGQAPWAREEAGGDFG